MFLSFGYLAALAAAGLLGAASGIVLSLCAYLAIRRAFGPHHTSLNV